MHTEASTPPRLAPRLADSLNSLITARHSVFTLATFAAVAGLPPEAARERLSDLLRLGLLRRLRREIADEAYLLVPERLGLRPERVPRPFPLAALISGGEGYYLSHATALELHGAGPVLPVIYVTRPVYTHPRDVLGTRFRFLQCQPRHYFGWQAHELGPHAVVQVSDLERTIVDGARGPKYCGGLPAVLAALYARRQRVDAERLVAYAGRMGQDNLSRRLGYLMEVCRLDAAAPIARLREGLRAEATYVPLDPGMPRRGVCCPRWRLHINVNLDMLEGAVGLDREAHLEMMR